MAQTKTAAHAIALMYPGCSILAIGALLHVALRSAPLN